MLSYAICGNINLNNHSKNCLWSFKIENSYLLCCSSSTLRFTSQKESHALTHIPEKHSFRSLKLGTPHLFSNLGFNKISEEAFDQKTNGFSDVCKQRLWFIPLILPLAKPNPAVFVLLVWPVWEVGHRPCKYAWGLLHREF